MATDPTTTNVGPGAPLASPEDAPRPVPPFVGFHDAPLLDVLDRAQRLEDLADRAFSLALKLGDADPTGAGIASLTVEARFIATELQALRESENT